MARTPAPQRRFSVTGRDAEGDLHVFITDDQERAEATRRHFSGDLENVEVQDAQRQSEAARAALIAELHRQAKQTGCHTTDDGRWVQVDGGFDVDLLVLAVFRSKGRMTQADQDPDALLKGIEASVAGQGRP